MFVTQRETSGEACRNPGMLESGILARFRQFLSYLQKNYVYLRAILSYAPKNVILLKFYNPAFRSFCKPASGRRTFHEVANI